MTSYQKRLLVFLSAVTFLDGYQFTALAQLLPQIRAEFGLDKWQGSLLISFVNIGTLLSWALIRAADRFGRRRVLELSLLGHTAMSLLTAFSPSLEFFALFHLVARIFFAGEWALAVVMAAEEFPAQRRGFVLNIVGTSAGFGMVACVAIVPMAPTLPLGWRGVFLVGLVPILLLAYARRGLRETARFEKVARESRPTSFIWSSPYRNRIIELALVAGLTAVCLQPAAIFWKDFAVTERGWSEYEVSKAVVFASALTLPFALKTGALLDQFGRRNGAVLAYGCIILGVLGKYTLHDPRALILCLVLNLIGAHAAGQVIGTYTTERFPTERRADAHACKNLLGHVALILAPLLVGLNVTHSGWGPAVAATTIGPLVALVLIQRRLPETRGLELEETAALKREEGADERAAPRPGAP